jgi:hypothetical protein
MIIFLKLAIVIIFVLILIRLKIDLGFVLFSGSLLAGLIVGMSIKELIKVIYNTSFNKDTFNLIGIILLVLLLGKLLQFIGNFQNMVNSLNHIIPEPRIAMVLPASIIGLLPMLGGALLSAPMIEEGSREMNVSPEEKTFLNYWFRHIWEYCWPLYPGLIVAITIVKIPIEKLIIIQFPFTILAIILGLIILFLRIPKIRSKTLETRGYLKNLILLFKSLWPIILVLILIFLIEIPMILALGIVVLFIFILAKINIKEKFEILIKSISLKIIFLLYSVMLFKRVILESNIFSSILNVIGSKGVASIALLFLTPFLIAFLTGVNQAYVAVSFPILLPIFGVDRPDLIYVMFAYVSGFLGILLSPAHLCLILTLQYFNAELKKVYRILYFPVGIIGLTVFLVLLFSRIL